jgi:hypothetical protein
MQQNAVLIQNLNTIELENLISTSVKNQLENFKKELNTKAEPEDLMTREEVIKLLKIDPSTLYLWTRKGKIKVHKYANKCYYKRSELMQSLTPLNKEAV